MSNNSSPKQQELKHIASIVRALVTSRKPPCYMKDVLREYPEVESKPFPHESLGYKSAQELLEDTGEFIFNGSRGKPDTIITAKFSNKSAHITSLVRGQKPSKSARIAPVKVMKQPLRMPVNRSNGFGDRNNNNNSNNFSSFNNRSNSSQQFSQQRLHQTQNNTQLQRQKSMGSGGQTKDLREMLNSKKNEKIQLRQADLSKQQQQTKQQQNANQAKQGGPRAILGAAKPSVVSKESQNQVDSKKQQNSKPQQQAPQPQNSLTKQGTTPQNERQPSQAIGQKPQQRLNITKNNQQTAQPAIQTPKAAIQPQNPTIQPSMSNLASRLQLQQQQQQHVQSQQLPNPPQSSNQSEQIKPNATPGLQSRLKVCHKPEYSYQANKPPCFNQYSPNQFVPKFDTAVAALAQYCLSKKFAPPRYNSIKGKFTRGIYSCCVHVDNTIYSTYPDEYEFEHEAKEACAKRALDKIRMQEKKRPLPSCTFTDTELLDKLYTELLNHPHGIFAKNLPEWFETTFRQSLPDNWWALIQTSSLFTTETGLSKVIIFANKDADRDVTPLSANEKTKIIQIDPIRLPWSDEHWNIFITHCTSTIEVWGRLFGEDYSLRFGALMNDIEAYMGTKKERPVSITRKNIYLVCINDSWHRVRVEELDKSKGCALCFFIDFGDADWVSVDQLCICETHFLRLPAQAVPFSLYGLEDFEGNPYARKCLDDLLPTKSVVGRIFTKESEFYDTDSKFHGKIQVVFFDTSTQEDINLNHQLSNTICKETLAPEIKQTTVINVIVTHVNDKGDIFLQINGPELKYLQTLLQQIVESKFKKDQHKITYEDFTRSNMFLVCDDNDANDIKWYRASLASTDIKPDNKKYLMKFIDHGLTKDIDISKIFLLESLSMALSNFPAQAITVRLHNIPDITKNIVGLIRGLLPCECEALARLVVPGAVPLVIIYTRLDGPGRLCTINDVIRIEHELEGSGEGAAGSDDSNAPSKFTLDFSKAKQHNSSSTSLASPSTPTSNSFIDVTRGLTLTTVPGSPQKPSDLPKLNNYAAIPSIGDYFEVRITMSANPSNFTIQPYKDYPNLRTLMKELQEFCDTNDEFIPTDMVEVGEAFAAKNPDGFFHRVTVVKKYGDMIHVSFCDFGDIATLESSQLKTLPMKFRQLPKMAIQAKLHGIKAANGDWTLDDCLFFRKLTVGQTFVSVIKNVTLDKNNSPPTQLLELDLIDVKTDDDVFIHEILLDEKRAIKEY